MKLLFIFSVLFLGLKAQEVDDYEIDNNDVVDYSVDPSFLINDDDDFELDEYDFEDDEEVSDYFFVDDENDYEEESDDYDYGDVSDYDFVDDDDEEFEEYDEEDNDISDYDLADDQTNLYDYQNWINDGDDYADYDADYDADDIGDDDESKALDEILGKLEKYQTAHRTMFIISGAVVLTALVNYAQFEIWLYLCKCRARGDAAKTELPTASQGRADKRKLYGVTVKK